MGTPQFAVPALEAIVEAGHEVACVYTQPPRPAGRGKKIKPSPVHQRADALGIEVRSPASLKGDAEQSAIADLAADICVVVAYGLILPKAVLTATARGCVNIHASLLPRWRGAAPIHRAIMAGDAQTGVCIMQMEAGLDTGPILMRDTTDIGASETTADLHDRFAEMGGRLIVDTLARFDTLTPDPQPDVGVTYAHKIEKSEAKIDWARPAPEVSRQINGLSPFPGGWTTHRGMRVKLLRSSVAVGEGAPGEVLEGFVIACGSGAVEILEAQIEGRGRQGANAFLNGTPLMPGTILGG